MKRIIIPAIAIMLAFAGSAFTSAKRSNSNLFVYTGSSYAQTDIENINNYAASATDPCGGTSTNVCSVTLATAKAVGQKPASTDFNAEKGNLWTSQQNHSAADGSIEMKP